IQYGGPYTGVNGRVACAAGNQGGTAISMSSLDGTAFLFRKGVAVWTDDDLMKWFKSSMHREQIWERRKR
ncbi:MAG: hypothetical protein IJL95_03710, partial [Solobacterium sp.]|nr:hypothetical protein [Solobacterium sp.]